jgi:hypothetical protein
VVLFCYSVSIRLEIQLDYVKLNTKDDIIIQVLHMLTPSMYSLSA